MMNTIAFDVASEVSSVCVLNARGRMIKEDRIPTRIGQIKKLIKGVPRPRQVVFEEGTQAAWLFSELRGIAEEILVCDPRQNVGLSGQFKSDRNDARNLAKRAQQGALTSVWHGGVELQNLKEAVRLYQSLTEESVRLKNQLKAVFRSDGVAVGQKAYQLASRKKALEDLRLVVQRERVQRLGLVLDLVTKQRALALKTLVKHGRRNSMYRALRRIDGIGPIFATMFIAEVGDPHRFRTCRQLWSYAGLAIATGATSEFGLKDNKVMRKSKAVRTRGLVRAYNHTLKYVLKQSAMTLSRTKWKTYYCTLLERSKNANNAQLTLARKLAATMLRIAKTGEKYDIAKVLNAQ